VVRGHLRPDAAHFDEVMARLQHGIEAPVPDGVPDVPLTIADTITGFGLAVSAQRLYERRGRTLEGVRVLLEGFGNVGAAAALYLARSGARIVAIRDARRTCIDHAGADAAALTELIRRRTDRLLPADDPRVQLDPDGARFWNTTAEVFVCAAVSESLTPEILDRLAARGVRAIVCGANQPFREGKVGSTRVARHADRRFAVLADVLANCGMARTFSYLMEPDAQTGAEPIFRAVEATIRATLDEVLDRAADAEHGLLSATLGLALDRIGAHG
jgi:glutamate dehydrogenase (NAD(P)+)